MYSLMKYYGGKSRLSSRIVGYIEAFRVQYGLNTLIDVCGGSGKIVMAISPKMERVYNDIGLGLCCLMEVIQDERLTSELINTLQGIPYTRENFLEASRLWHSTEIELCKAKRASYTYISAQQSIVGNMKDFKWLSVEANNRKMVESYYSNLNNLWRVHHGVGKFDVTCEDWFDVLEAYKHRSNVLLFIDPPYDEQTCVSKYTHNIEREAHERLVSFLLSDGMRCRVILCGNYSELYTPLEDSGWSCIFLDRLQRQASLFTKNKRYADEFIWCNMAL